MNDQAESKYDKGGILPTPGYQLVTGYRHELPDGRQEHLVKLDGKCAVCGLKINADFTHAIRAAFLRKAAEAELPSSRNDLSAISEIVHQDQNQKPTKEDDHEQDS